MNAELRVVRVGVGVFVVRDGKFLVGRRSGSHGPDTWALPGGHLEFGETFAETAKREVMEETGVSISAIRFGAVTNDYFATEGKHYVTVWMLSDYAGGEAQICEPEKCAELAWVDFSSLPAPLFIPFQNLLQSDFIESIRSSCKL